MNYKSGCPRESKLKMWGSGRHSKNTPRASRLRRTGEANYTSLQNHNQTNSNRASMKSGRLSRVTPPCTRQYPQHAWHRAPQHCATLRLVGTDTLEGVARRTVRAFVRLKPPTLTTAPLTRPSKGAAQVVGIRTATVQKYSSNSQEN